MKLTRAGAGAAIVELDKELSQSSEKELLSIFDSLSQEKVRNILIDFNHVASIDNNGLNVLVKLHVKARNLHWNLLAIGVDKQFMHIFSMTGLDRVYRVYTSLADVLRAVGSGSGPDVKTILERPEKAGQGAAPGLGYWASATKKITVPPMPPGAVNLNVHGRRTAGPVQGFGQLWEKIYTVDLSDANLSPEKIIGILKSHFPEFQPPQNRFYTTPSGIKPGDVVLINASTPGGMVATGVLVLYASDISFTFITPQGHPEAGWVTFRSFVENGHTVMEVHGLARASDPIYEMAFRLAGSKLQQQIWTYLLQSLARYTGSSSPVQVSKNCLDKSLQWLNFFNVFWNAQALSMVYSATHPFRKRTNQRN